MCKTQFFPCQFCHYRVMALGHFKIVERCRLPLALLKMNLQMICNVAKNLFHISPFLAHLAQSAR